MGAVATLEGSVAAGAARAAASARLSESLWGIDFSATFPLTVSEDGVVVEVAAPDQALAFVRSHYATIFGTPEEGSFLAEGLNEARERYLRRVCDVFLFTHETTPVGLFIGNPVDWSTYYIRSTAFLRNYQGRALYQRFLAELFALLAKAGVSRVEADTAPSNLQCVTALTRQRFVVAGTALSERWGALTRFTRHLDVRAEHVFLQQFCASASVHTQKRVREASH